MTSTIAVRCERVADGHRCTVIVGDDPRATTHEVSLADGVLERLAPGDGGGGDPIARAEVLVRVSFEYLLEREPRESILRTFDLPVIERYLPGYEREIGARVATHLQGEGRAPDGA